MLEADVKVLLSSGYSLEGAASALLADGCDGVEVAVLQCR